MSPKASMLPRVWGTRFDTLPTTPPVSPSICEEIGSSHTSERIANSIVSADSLAPPASEGKEERTPHEASIFVGSLPANIDQPELTRLLSDHLSEHTEIQNIKVVRDSKGGVCAFVQCEDAASASILINTLQTRRPKPFLGRHLRYEPARAFRTLLISYRTPLQQASTSPSINYSGNILPSSTQPVPLELPFAMRLWRNPGDKFHTLLYNADAITAEAQNQQAHNIGKGRLFLHPLNFDEATIKSMASYFGNLEHCATYLGDARYQGTNVPDTLLPSPHDAPRADVMQSGCWEIKWKNRDDCVAALMTLRRIPHLTVTWAHQPSGAGFGARNHSTHFRQQQNFAAYPFYVEPSQTHGSPNPTGADASLKAAKSSSSEQSIGEGEDLLASLQHISLKPASERLDWAEVEASPTPSIGESTWNTGTPWVPRPSQVTSTRQEWHGSQDNPRSAPFPRPASFAPPLSSAMNTRNGHRSGREIDPCTLFVGGLETFGSSAWTEEKLANFFRDYSGLENIRLVLPQNGNTGFAFIRFNNADSPQRAVIEKHNSVFEGRVMRVQLREIHPRNYWRYARGRGRIQPQISISHQLMEGIPSHCIGQGSETTLAVDKPTTEIPNSPNTAEMTLAEPPAYSEQVEAENHQGVNCDNNGNPGGRESANDLPHGSPSSTAANDTTAIANNSVGHEQVTDAPTGTPPLHVMHTPMSPGYPYPTPYYHPSAWIHPYAQPMPYQLPYMAYSAQYHHGHLPPYLTRPLQLDATSPVSAGTPWGTAGAYATPPTRTPTNDPTQHQGLNSRAPLSPSGFLHNDYGTLVPVYQPEGLESYVTDSSQSPSASRPPVAAVTSPQPAWHHPHYQSYPYLGMHQMLPPGQRPDAPALPVSAASGQPAMHSQSSSTTAAQDPSSADQVYQDHAGCHAPSSFHRRHHSRKDYNPGRSSGKFHYPPRPGNRHTRSTAQDSETRHQYDSHSTEGFQQIHYSQAGWANNE